MNFAYGEGSFEIANSGNALVELRASRLAEVSNYRWGSSITNLIELHAPETGGVGSIEIETHPDYAKNGDLYLSVNSIAGLGLFVELAMKLEDSQGEMHWDVSHAGPIEDGIMHHLPRTQPFDLYFFGTDFLPSIPRADFGMRQGTHTTPSLARWSLATLTIWGVKPA